MDYQQRLRRLTILYPLRPEGIRGYFAYDVASAVDIRVDLSPMSSTIESTLHPLAAEDVFDLLARFPDWQRITIQETGLTGVGLFDKFHGDAYQFCLVL